MGCGGLGMTEYMGAIMCMGVWWMYVCVRRVEELGPSVSVATVVASVVVLHVSAGFTLAAWGASCGAAVAVRMCRAVGARLSVMLA